MMLKVSVIRHTVFGATLDQLTPFYDNTPADGFFATERKSSSLSDAEINRLVQGLLTSLDLAALLETALKAIQQRLPVKCLQLTLPDKTFSVGRSNKSKGLLKKSFELDHSQLNSSISYQMTSELNCRQWPLLLELHSIVKRPLQLALDFYAVQQLAMRDHLTGLGNRAEYQETVQRHLSAANRHNHGFSLLVFDLDRFKQVNDTFGHTEGDKVLVTVANILNENMRETDFAFRLGGDEFVCLLADGTKQACVSLAERVKHAVQENKLLNRHGVSCSIGSANYQTGDDAESLFSRADSALYRAKQAGRDRHIAA